MTEELVEKLMMLGLREYEAKVYAALVITGPARASEIARESGVPRPRVYDVLKRLHERGFVEVSEGSPAYFRAVEPENVIASLRDEYIRSAEEAIIMLKSYQRERREEWLPVWYLQGEWSVRSRAEELAGDAGEEFVTAFLEPTFVLKFRRAFERARENGITPKILLITKATFRESRLEELGDVYYLPLAKVLEGEPKDFMEAVARALFSTGERYVVRGLFVRDSRESLLVYEDGGIRGILVKIPFIPVIQREVVEYYLRKLDDYSSTCFSRT
ncbi:helix-turn-helix domain-containing protein [Thermococcus sp. 21S7]|uniref:TrmB family transcriptional regulator n=1 Tax=Thermococcus sp. 21S7 TaxID=1638221 RepID=UPI001438E50E|nr:helix-turn-helix domain-containing protein [Thermococcus sp. 21S7]NJE61573.1 TrmB family transcriptional regulator [Thermococcus sp. 21S7]